MGCSEGQFREGLAQVAPLYMAVTVMTQASEQVVEVPQALLTASGRRAGGGQGSEVRGGDQRQDLTISNCICSSSLPN